MKNLSICLILFLFNYTVCGQNQTDSLNLQITISSDDLSEDMSSLSSGNDELILFVYHSDSVRFGAPIFLKEFELNRKKKSHILSLNINQTGEQDFTFIIIERDSHVSLKRIEPVLRIYHNEIKELFDARKTSTLEEYLGDEDLLLYCNIDLEGMKESSCTKGYINNLDTYKYKILVEIQD